MEIKYRELIKLINLKWRYTLALLFFMSSSMIFAVPNFNLRERIGNILLSPIAYSQSSKTTKEKAQEIIQRLSPKSQATVRNLNALGRLLIGYKNTVSIPFINYVLVNEKWLDSLHPKAKEFVLARSMIYLFSYPYEYTLYKYIFPVLLYNLCRLVNECMQFSSNISSSKKQLICYLSEIFLYLLKPYYLRKIEYEIDAKAVIEFDCFEGAIDALSNSIKYSHKGSFLDKLNSIISATDIFDLALNFITFYAKFDPSYFSSWPIIQKALNPGTISELTFPLTLLLSPQFLLPGRFTDRQSAIFNVLKNLPIINLFFDYPKPYKRIRALTDLKNKILKQKIKEEKLKQKQ